MNFPKHSWDTKVKPNFLEFLKVAETLKNDHICDAEEYNRLNKIIYLDEETTEELKLFSKQTEVCIDITQSDDEHDKISVNRSVNQTATNLENSSKHGDAIFDINTGIQDELLEEIKDGLSAEEIVVRPILDKLVGLNKLNLKDLFNNLAKRLTTEEIKKFWVCLSSDGSNIDSIMANFIQFLVLPNAKLAYNYEFEEVFSAMSEKDGKLLRSELIQDLMKKDDCDNQIIIQYLNTFDKGYKTELLRDFMNSMEKLQSNYIPVIEILLNPQVSQDVLCQVIEMMASYAMDFCSDNAYGKLLYKLVNLLDKKFTSLEQPLKRILGTHKSIWKMKIEKCIVSWFNETLTQSFL